MTEEDQDDFFEDVERIDKVLSYVCDILGTCLKTFSDNTAMSNTILEKFVPLYAECLKDVTKAKDYELSTSLGFFCDCIEFGSEHLMQRVLANGLIEKYN